MTGWRSHRGLGSSHTPADTTGVEPTPAGPVAVEPVAIEQTAQAKGGATVFQAGRDVITGNVFAGRFARLRDAWIDPALVFEEADVRRFVGREWLVSAVDTFIEKHDRGYVVVQAAAGLGKTAFAAWLAWTRGLPCHFTRRRKGRVASTALRNLAAQLIARYELADRFAPNGMLPETAGEPGWFDQVLRAAAESAARGGTRVVLIVDGLDEAEHVDGDLPLALPAVLPAGVYVIATCRTGTPLAALRQPWTSLNIDADDRRNAADLRKYLTAAAAEQPLAGKLAEAGMPPKAFAQQLINRCGGVWVYLRYVLNELRFGMRGLDELDRLPVDLAGYYLESLTAPNGDPALVGYRLPLLTTLAAVAEPLPLHTLASLAGLPSPEVAQSLCHGILRPFLTVSSDEEPRYGVYHVSLREFLGGAVPQRAMDVTRYRATEFARATRQAHARIAHHYLELFGGIDANLERLAANPGLAGTDGGYPRRYLAYHLERAGQVDTLHRLLSCELAAGPERATNVWFAVHDGAGSIDDYLTDLRRARRQAELQTNAQLTASEPPTGLHLEIRYTAIMAAVATLTANVPIPLLHRLVTAGLWDIDQALRHARQLHDPTGRARALAALVPEVPAAARATVLDEALAAARDLVDDGARASVLKKLSQHLKGRPRYRVLADALTAAINIADSERRARALSNLAPLLPGRLATVAFEATRGIAQETRRAIAVCNLAPRLPPEVAERAHASGAGIAAPAERAIVLGALALRLAETRRERELQRAWELAGTADLLEARAWAMWWLATELPEPAREQAIAKCLTAAREIPDDANRALALGRIVRELGPSQRDEVVAEALGIALAHEDVATRAWLVGSWTMELRDDQRELLAARLLQEIRDLPTDWDKVAAVSEITWQLSERLMPDALDFVTTRVTDGYARNWIIGELAPQLPARLVGEALATTRTMSSEYGRAQVLCQIAQRMPEPLHESVLAEAVEAGQFCTDPHSRARVLAELAPHLVPADHDRALAVALDTARSAEGVGNVYTLLRVACRLPQSRCEEVVSTALEICRETIDPEQRARRLYWVSTMTSPYLQLDDVTVEALAAIRSLPDSIDKAMLLAGLIQRVAAGERTDLLAEVLELFQRLGNDDSRLATKIFGRLVRPVLRLVPRQALVDSIAIAASLAWLTTADVAEIRIEPLRELVAVVLRYVPRRVMTDMITAVRRMPSDYDISVPLGAVALLLPEPHRTQALAEALDTIRYTTPARRAILAIAGQLPEQTTIERIDLVRRCLDNVNLDEFFSVLATGIPILHAVGGQAAVESCLETVRLIQRCWPSGTS